MIKIGNINLSGFPLLLAPMEDVSDPPFRAVCKKHGADLMYTEFISSEGLIRDAMKSRQKLDIFEEERPVGIQIFGGDEEAMAISAGIVDAVNPDLLDINFGCPVKKVVCKGAGAAVLKDIDLMVRLTKAVIKSCNVPVTVKTRLGWDFDSINIIEVAERLQDIGVQPWKNKEPVVQRRGRLELDCEGERPSQDQDSHFWEWRCRLTSKSIGIQKQIWCRWDHDRQGGHWLSLVFP